MAEVQILDCTLRDGGYRNDWRFGDDAARAALGQLARAGLDYAECGFWQDGTDAPGRTVFGTAGRLRSLVPQGTATRFVAMAIWGRCDLAALPPARETGLFGLRLSFDRHEAARALAEAPLIAQKGYALFLQPVRLTTNYTRGQVRDLLKAAGALGPHAVYMVDSLGVLSPETAAALYREMCDALAPGIAVGLHVHNHRQLALANALATARLAHSGAGGERPLIVDSCLGGMGKAAGNVPTEGLVHAWRGPGPNAGAAPGAKATRAALEAGFEGVLRAMDALGGGLHPAYPVAYFLASAAGCNTAYADWLRQQGVATMAGLYAAMRRIPPKHRAFFSERTAQFLLM